MYEDGRLIRDGWTTDWTNVEGGEEAEEAFRAWAAYFQVLGESMGAAMGGGSAVAGQTFLEEMNLLEGLPVVTRGFDEVGTLQDEATLGDMAIRDLGPNTFEPLPTYDRGGMGPGGSF